MANEPTDDDELLNFVVEPTVSIQISLEALESANAERTKVIESIVRYGSYINTLLPDDKERQRAHGYLEYLEQRRRELIMTENAAIQELFKSSNEIVMSHIGTPSIRRQG